MSRPFFIIGCLLLMLLPACSKSHSPQPGLIGQWRLTRSVNTIGIVWSEKNYDPLVRLLQLLPDSTYIVLDHLVPIESGSYNISLLTGGNLLETMISFRPRNSVVYQRLMRLNGSQLYLNFSYGYDLYEKQ